MYMKKHKDEIPEDMNWEKNVKLKSKHTHFWRGFTTTKLNENLSSDIWQGNWIEKIKWDLLQKPIIDSWAESQIKCVKEKLFALSIE